MATGDPAPVPTSRVLDWPVNVIWILVELLPWIWVLWMVKCTGSRGSSPWWSWYSRVAQPDDACMGLSSWAWLQ
jgi:hypothetical protein